METTLTNTYVKYASVALDVRLDQLLDYGIEDRHLEIAVPGSRVVVPLRHQMQQGTIVEIKDAPDFDKIHPILEVSAKPLLTKDLLELAKWISDYYMTPLRSVLSLIIPTCIKKEIGPKLESFIERKQSRQIIQEALGNVRKKSPKQALVLDVMLHVKKGIFLSELKRKTNTTKATIDQLIKKGFLKERQVEKERSPLEHLDFIQTQKKQLTTQQQLAFDKIEDALEAKRFEVFLLHGLTGSGKTEIYLQAIDNVLKKGQSALLMVPEISLTHQTIERLFSRFYKKIAVLHHRLSSGERFDEWQKVYTQDASIVVGPRSSIFSPMQNLGLIIVDEEHDPSYKQSEKMPAINARDVAIMRAKINKCPVILGSATPSLESYHNTQKKNYTLLELNERINAKLPTVHIVDMQKEHEKKNFIFSDLFLQKFKERQEKKEQTLIFLNRRGFHAFQICPECNEILKCPHCDVSLTFHKSGNKLTCHLCAYSLYPPPKQCPSCKHEMLKFRGIGTEFVETQLRQLFPSTQIVRMDADTTRTKGAHKALIDRFKSKKANVLIGTQMIAKGLHIPSVTLVLVLNCDLTLNLPDFKAPENVFQLVTQVAGRSGRGHLPGEVVLQTKFTNHPVIQCAAKEDYKRFFNYELEQRKVFLFPPHNKLIKLMFRSFDEKSLLRFANQYFEKIKEKLSKGYTLYPLVPCGISKIKDQFRYQILVKGPNVATMHTLFSSIEIDKPKNVSCFFDIDPYSTFF